MIFDLTEAEEKIGYRFRDQMLLRQAFTHSSYVNENRGTSNEVLEFLGDSVLNFVIAEELVKRHPDWQEGELSKGRAALVSFEPLAEAVMKLKLNENLLVGAGEVKNLTNKNICADLFEAVVAALYLDAGLPRAREFILANLKEQRPVRTRETKESRKDAKSRLSEYAQKRKLSLEYVTERQDGPPHAPVFVVGVRLGGDFVAHGRGKSKKIAEQDAAKAALAKV